MHQALRAGSSWMTGNPSIIRQRKVCRQGLSRWRGGRYRVVNQESSGTADIVWVIGKEDSCDPFTQDDAGGTPASQLLCHHHAQLPAGGKRFCQAFWQVSRQARPQRTSNLSSLCPPEKEATRRACSALYPTMRELNRDLALWAKRKYKKLRSHLRKAKHWIARSRAALRRCSPTGNWEGGVAP